MPEQRNFIYSLLLSPIVLEGSDLIGSICISGLAGYEDHAVIVKVLEEYLGR